MATRDDSSFDLLVVGGGINGVAIARDAAGRGLSVLLVEKGDLAQATSSASSKLVHGGLRYLEQYEFRLVRESLAEREVLLAAAPHVIWPLKFVLPVHRGLRPPWMLRAGLLLYDHIGGRRSLPATRTVRRGDADMAPLADAYGLGFSYYDCWADDARLTVLAALDAAERGAQVATRTALTAARRDGGLWSADLTGPQGPRTVQARAVVNAAGPWVGSVLKATGGKAAHVPRLVKGSHIVTRRLYDGDQAFTFQNADGRVVFAIPYEHDFTLIGTTDIPYAGDPAKAAADEAEIAYLCAAAGEYLKAPVTPADVVWTYSGVRPLYDDGDASASAVTRDYAFDLDAAGGRAPLLSIFGGKLTTHRRLAEHALRDLQPLLGFDAGPWTARAKLPGGALGGDFQAFAADRLARYAFAPAAMVRRLCRAYGARIDTIMAGATSLPDLGEEVAPQMFEAELRYLRDVEWARTGQDVLWRRSKQGLHLDAAQRARIDAWMAG